MSEKCITVVCSGDDTAESLSIRSDNLSTISTFLGAHSLPTKHASTLTPNFILTADMARVMKLGSTHLHLSVQKGECGLPEGTKCIYSAGDYLACGTEDGTLRIWRISDGELVIEQPLHIGALSVLYIDTLLWVVFAGSETGRIGAWAIPDLYTSADNLCVWDIHSLKITDLVVSTGGRVYSVSTDKTMKCYDFMANTEIQAVSFPSALTCCALAHNESVFYCGDCNGDVYSVQLIQDSPAPKVFHGHTAEVCDILISEDDRSLYTCALDQTVRRWDTSTGQTVNQIQTKTPPFGLHWFRTKDAKLPTAGEEQTKRRQTKKERLQKRGATNFPRLQKQINPNKDQMITAPVDDVPVLSLEDELMIAVSDLSSAQQMNH